MAALIAVYLALFHKYEEYLSPGEKGVVVIVAADRSQAQVILNYCKGFLNNNPVFTEYVVEELKESVHLKNNIIIEVHSCSYRSVRGRTVIAALFDEICFWRDAGANPDVEIVGAVRPSTATIPNAKIIGISSPYSKRGVLYEIFRDYYGQDDSDILVWQAPTRIMNPLIPQALIDRETQKDPSAARAEWEAQWREDIESFLSLEAVEACALLSGIQAFESNHVYRAFCDPSGGRADAFTLGIGHQDRHTKKLTVDLIRGWPAPLNPETAVKEICEILTQYHIGRITGDRYAGEWVSSAFNKHNISYTQCSKPKSDLYLSLEAYVNTKRVKFPQEKRLIDELVNLERRRGRSGKDIIDHPPRGSDDYANSLAGVCHALLSVENSLFAHCDLN
jgi:hypothetical protein